MGDVSRLLSGSVLQIVTIRLCRCLPFRYHSWCRFVSVFLSFLLLGSASGVVMDKSSGSWVVLVIWNNNFDMIKNKWTSNCLINLLPAFATCYLKFLL